MFFPCLKLKTEPLFPELSYDTNESVLKDAFEEYVK